MTAASANRNHCHRKSLLLELRDGDAGPGIRVFISLAVASVLTGLAFAVPYCLTLLWPSLGRRRGSGGLVYVDEIIIVWAFLVAGLLYLSVLYWLWNKPLRRRGFWLAGALTIGIWIIAVTLCIAAEGLLTGDEEYVIAGIIFVASGVTLVMWVQMWRKYGRGRPAFGNDGKMDLRCPNCNYSMTGLSEARCPECGEHYTLDDLLARQGFADMAATAVQRE